MLSWSDLVVHLGDNPAGGWTTWSAISGRLPAFRQSGGIFYLPAYSRHLLLREMYLSMGYLTFDVRYRNFLKHAYRVFVPGVTWNDMRAALGNSMHVAQVGTFAACMLLCARRKTDAYTWADLLEVMDQSL